MRDVKMFNVDDRELMIQIISPEPGWRMTNIIGTSFNLDLKWLLQLMVQLYKEEESAIEEPDITVLLNAIKLYKKIFLVFTERGRLLSSKYTKVMELLRNSIVQVPAKNTMFHPKVWLCRYETEDNGIAYRLLVMSMNAVFGNALEGCIMLEGCYKKNLKNQNQGLSSFLGYLFDNAPSRPDEDIILELGSVQFKGDDKITLDDFYWQGGDVKTNSTFKIMDLFDCRFYNDIVVFSPFTKPQTVSELQNKTSRFTLISNRDNLEKYIHSGHFNEYSDFYFIKDFNLHENDLDPQEDESESMELSTKTDESPVIGGYLHAKMYFLQKDDKNMDIIIGSSNFTGALNGYNVEAVVKLTTRSQTVEDIRREFLYGEDGKTLNSFIRIFDKDLLPEDRENDEEERKIEDILKTILHLNWKGKCESEIITIYPDDSEKELSAISDYFNDLSVNLLSEKNEGALQRNEFQFILKYPVSGIPGAFFIFKYQNKAGGLFIPIDDGEGWELRLEQEIMKVQQLPAWYNYIFSLLYAKNRYKRDKLEWWVSDYQRVTGSGQAFINSGNISIVNLENILSLGKLDNEVRQTIGERLAGYSQIESQLEDSVNGLNCGEDEQSIRRYEETSRILNDLKCFRDLWGIYSEVINQK